MEQALQSSRELLRQIVIELHAGSYQAHNL